MPEFSICIPTYEYKGRGVEFLSHLLDTLEKQTLDDYEVIISDHSQDDEIQNYLSGQGDRFDIKYYRNENKRGNLSNNTNQCLSMSTGRIIKPVYQDDFFYTDIALEEIKKAFDTEECQWLATACNHYDDELEIYCRDFYPNFDEPEATLFGKNLISCPTVIAFLNDAKIEFDENLNMLMDCEFYYRMYKKHGKPFLLNQILMTNRSHSGQSQKSKEFEEKIQEEMTYCYDLFNKQNYNLGT